jgi:antirestriction protein ArdC
LWCAAQANSYADARWATYRQWAALGAQVRKAERGTLVLFYKELPRSARPGAQSGGDAETADGAPFVARAAHVFNAAQVDPALPSADAPAHDAVFDLPPAFDAFVASTGAAIRHGGARACYIPSTDAIHLPARSAFGTAEGYTGTLAHELVHWSGAPHRLARDLTGRFGTRDYAAEELVAELGAAFVLAELGIARTPHPDHAAYCAAWAPLLRGDPRALGHAAAHASRAAEYLAGLPLNPGQAPRNVSPSSISAVPALRVAA